MRNTRIEYLYIFYLWLFFEAVLSHNWRIHDFYKQRTVDEGLFDKSNYPIVAHNNKLFTLLRTEISMHDFCDFTSVDVHDQIRDNYTNFDEKDKVLLHIT